MRNTCSSSATARSGVPEVPRVKIAVRCLLFHAFPFSIFLNHLEEDVQISTYCNNPGVPRGGGVHRPRLPHAHQAHKGRNFQAVVYEPLAREALLALFRAMGWDVGLCGIADHMLNAYTYMSARGRPGLLSAFSSSKWRRRALASRTPSKLPVPI